MIMPPKMIIKTRYFFGIYPRMTKCVFFSFIKETLFNATVMKKFQKFVSVILYFITCEVGFTLSTNKVKVFYVDI